jgi:hypothetical protein
MIPLHRYITNLLELLDAAFHQEINYYYHHFLPLDTCHLSLMTRSENIPFICIFWSKMEMEEINVCLLSCCSAICRVQMGINYIYIMTWFQTEQKELRTQVDKLVAENRRLVIKMLVVELLYIKLYIFGKTLLLTCSVCMLYFDSWNKCWVNVGNWIIVYYIYKLF